MSVIRIFQAGVLALHSLFHLDEKASHHLSRVMRSKVGDQVIVFNGQGGEYHAHISHIDKKKVTLEIQTFNPREAESHLTIYLAQGLARGEKMDWIIQKAVELGVKKIIPLESVRSTVRLDDERASKRLKHWEAIVISACEQSGRNRIPEILPVQSLSACLSSVKTDYRFILSPHATNKDLIHPTSSAPSILLLIGPEGGFSDAEVEVAIKQGVLPLNLGPRILRTETAGMAAMALLQGLYGDMSFQ